MKKEQKSPSYDLKFGSYFFASEMNISLMNFTKLDLNLPKYVLAMNTRNY